MMGGVSFWFLRSPPQVLAVLGSVMFHFNLDACASAGGF